MQELPAGALPIVARIESLVRQGEPLAAGRAGEEPVFSLRETQRRYLPETIEAYLRIPHSRRDAAAEASLIAPLPHLERAAAGKLAKLSAAAEDRLAANGAFLAGRFGPAEALPEAIGVPADAPATGVSEVLARRVFERLEWDVGEPAEVLDRVAGRFSVAFPALTKVKRSGLFGRGAPESVSLDVPRSGDTLRYALAGTPAGLVPSVTRIVRGVALKTANPDAGEWIAALIDDLRAYLDRERSAREALARLFGGT
jgi:hypothetical protein